ncbi:MAG: DUF1294 domain-containing protein [Oscillospiraceae bacterium]|nr:DUF1294 domain-containing protein [Oscillospiraceae bacterium]
MKIYLLIMNVLGLVLMLADKQFAIRKTRRIPEATLFAVAALGGSLGVWAGIWLFRHKTRKAKFTIGIPVILAAQAAIWWLAMAK